MDKKNSETGCCPKFNPKPWENKTITWKDKLFLKDHVISFFHIPLNFGSKMKKNMKLINDNKALSKDMIVLSFEHSLWGSELYITTSKIVPGAHMIKISGTFMTKVFEGSYKNAGKWAKEMEAYVKSKKKEMKKLYFYYTTCPKCAKVYGKNYAVLLAEI